MFIHRRPGDAHGQAGRGGEPLRAAGGGRNDQGPVATAAHRSDPRERLLAAMVETVARRGWAGTDAEGVAARAGLGRALFYEHFDDERDCLRQAVDALVAHGEAAARELVDDPRPWEQRVRAGIERLLVVLADNEAATRVLFVEMLSAGVDARERLRGVLALSTALVEQGRIGLADTEHLPPQTSEAIVGGVASILHRRALEGEIEGLCRLRKDLTYFALLPYLEHERALAVATYSD